MRIGVNLIPLRPGRMGGLEFYVRNLLTHLLAIDTRNRYFLFTAWWNHDSIDLPYGRYKKILVVQKPAGQDHIAVRGAKGIRWWSGLTRLPLRRNIASTSFADLHNWARHLRLDLWFCPMINLEPRQL